MTRFIFRAIDFGASIVFMALCAKMFGAHLYEDLRRHTPSRPTSSGFAKSWAQTPAE
jgi:hypothetical protein